MAETPDDPEVQYWWCVLKFIQKLWFYYGHHGDSLTPHLVWKQSFMNHPKSESFNHLTIYIKSITSSTLSYFEITTSSFYLDFLISFLPDQLKWFGLFWPSLFELLTLPSCCREGSHELDPLVSMYDWGTSTNTRRKRKELTKKQDAETQSHQFKIGKCETLAAPTCGQSTHVWPNICSCWWWTVLHERLFK